MSAHPHLPSAPVDPTFVFTLESYAGDVGPGRRWSTWWEVEVFCRGRLGGDRAAAVDTELGILTTGEEADVFLLERAVEHGIVHGDLSAYDVPAAGERPVVIDLPQLVDPRRQPSGRRLLAP